MTAPRYAAKVKSGPLRTANSAEKKSNGSNGSAQSGHMGEIEEIPGREKHYG
jgi:hypothetical protein